MNGEISIGETSRRCGVKVPTIRYYEQIGLLPPPPRTEGNRRSFDEANLRRLAFIRHARELGFEIEAIRTLLTRHDTPHPPCGTADTNARARLAAVTQRIESLQALKAELNVMIESCRHGKVADCRVIEVLADHSQCLELHHPF